MEKEIGSIETGKRADLVVVQHDSVNQIPYYNIYSDLVYSTKASDVQTVIINGKIVMRDRRLLTLDEVSIRENVRIFRDRILKSLSSLGAGKN
jgi:5-methylthioadenosine/S-adenosylhomocysteine deaminase